MIKWLPCETDGWKGKYVDPKSAVTEKSVGLYIWWAIILDTFQIILFFVR